MVELDEAKSVKKQKKKIKKKTRTDLHWIKLC